MDADVLVYNSEKDKIYRYEKEQKEVEPLSPSQTQRIKEALFIVKSFHNIYFSQNQDR